MPKLRTVPAARDRVVVTNPDSFYVGERGVVRRIRGQRAPYEAVVELDMHDDGVTTTLPRNDIELIEALPVSVLMALDEAKAKREADERARSEAFDREYREKKLARYVNQRVESVLICDAPAQIRGMDKVDPSWSEDLRFIEADPMIRGAEYFSAGVSARIGQSFGDFEASVNWSAYGSVSPEQALKFAQTLITVANAAIEARDTMEAQQGIDTRAINDTVSAQRTLASLETL